MDNKRRNRIIAMTIFSSIIIDQITKLIAINYLKFSPPREYLGGFFVLKYAENTGAMLGFGSELPDWARFWFLTVFVGCMLAGLLAYLIIFKEMNLQQTVGLSLISGGGISNFIDRAIYNGRVVDFMHIDTGYGWLKTGIFNFADVAIMIGLGIMILGSDWRHSSSAEQPDQSNSA